MAKTAPAKANPTPAGLGADLVGMTGAGDGWAVVLGADAALVDGLLAASKLDVLVLDPDAEKVAALRERLAPRYGVRVAAMAASLAEAKLPPYLASLVVAARGASPELLDEIARVLRPYGGAACLRVPKAGGAWSPKPPAGLSLDAAHRDKGWLVVRREGPLAGAGSWTHQYADAGNFVVGGERCIRAPLGLLWFGGPSNDDILPRHGHGPTPQVIGGRLFIEGRHILRALDVYTGRRLWEARIEDLGLFYNVTYHQPGAGATGSNYVSTPDGVYVITPQKCVKLDAATGRQVAEFHLPADLGRDAKWGFVTVWDRYLIAAAALAPEAAEANKTPRAVNYSASSRTLLVMDRQTGKLLWQRRAARTFRHNAIIAGGGKVFCIDGLSASKRGFLRRRGEPIPNDSVLYALDAGTGKVMWQTGPDAFGTWLGYSAKHNVVLQAGSAARDRANDETRTGLVVHRAADGKVVWEDREIAYTGPCMIHGDAIITNSGSFNSGFKMDLMTGRRLTQADPVTGKPVPWRYSRTYGCNTAIASEHLITFRSGAAGFVDLTTSTGTGNLGGFKSGCSSNLIPADGVLSAPDYTRTCTCSYQNQTSLAMVHMPDVEQWTFWNAGGPNLPSYGSQKDFDAKMVALASVAAGAPAGPVRRIGVNFGAPGDRQVGRTYWLEFPIVGGHSPAMGVKTIGGRAYGHHSGLFAGAGGGTDAAGGLAFVGASGLVGARKVTLTLDSRSEPPTRKFTVRLVFAEPDAKTAVGERVFDVSLQGRRVLAAFDLTKAAGAARRVVVREFRGVAAAATLTIDLTSVKGEPILCGVEVVAE